MDKPNSRGNIPWSMIIPPALLAGIVFVALRAELQESGENLFLKIGLVWVACSVLYFLGKLLGHVFWGMAMAVLPLAHPLVRSLALQPGPFLQAEILQLLTLTTLTGMWILTWDSRPRIISLLGCIIPLVFANALSWLTSALAGLSIFFLTCTGLLLGTILAELAFLGKRGQPERPAGANILVMVLITLATPPLGLMACQGIFEGAQRFSRRGNQGLEAFLHQSLEEGMSFWEIVPENIKSDRIQGTIPGFSWDALHSWAWPNIWVVLVLMMLGLWRAFYRGWLQMRLWLAPISWLMLLYTLAILIASWLNPESTQKLGFLPFAILSLVLSVFAAADLLRGMGEQLVLQPPEEQPSGEPSA